MCAYQGLRNVRFSANLTIFVFLKHPFWDSPFFLITYVAIYISSNTFSEVQEKSDQIWKYERYDLVIEYYNRPGLIPPFILLAHIWSLLTYIYKSCFKETKPQITNELRKWHNLIGFFSQIIQFHICKKDLLPFSQA